MLWVALAVAVSSSALNPDVRQDTIQHTICVPGYSGVVRPSSRYTNPIKLRLLREAGLSPDDADLYALDHRLAIGLGGHPRQPDNLQLLTQHDNSRKSRVEAKLICLVCTDALPLDQAQAEVWQDWQATYHRYARQKCSRKKARAGRAW